MKYQRILMAVILCFCAKMQAQTVKDFFYAEPETKNLPVFIRGNLDTNKILLYVQGGPGDNGIDFGRSDYPKWKNTLETKVAIAYFDQRGLNKPEKKIDTTKINALQIGKDIISIAKKLKEKYNAEIYLFGHSAGGQDVLDCLANFPDKSQFIKSGIAINTPITTDFSPERNTYYRPLYLKNVAKEFIAKNQDITHWQEALEWITNTDSIHNRETSKKWNMYVDKAFTPIERKISLGMILKVIFSRPYNPVKYLNSKDNELIADKLWEADRNLNRFKTLSNILSPILLISGRFDDIAGPEEQEAANQIIPDSQLVTLPNSGHQSFLDQPEQFNTAILKFINSH